MAHPDWDSDSEGSLREPTLTPKNTEETTQVVPGEARSPDRLQNLRMKSEPSPIVR